MIHINKVDITREGDYNNLEIAPCTEQEFLHWTYSSIFGLSDEYALEDDDIVTQLLPKEIFKLDLLNRIRTLPEWPRFVKVLEYFAPTFFVAESLLYVAKLDDANWKYIQLFTMGYQSNPDISKVIERLLRRAPRLRKKTNVYRIVQWYDSKTFPLSYRQEGRTYPVSTTLSRDVALKMTKGIFPSYEITLPKGTQCLYVGCLSQFFTQEEVIIDANTDFVFARQYLHNQVDPNRSTSPFMTLFSSHNSVDSPPPPYYGYEDDVFEEDDDEFEEDDDDL